MKKEKLKIIKITDVVKLIQLYCSQHDIFLSNLKLQKLLFFIQGWHLGYYNVELFLDTPEAWPNGPVYRTIYESLNNIPVYDQIIDIEIEIATTNDQSAFQTLSEKLALYKKQIDLIYAVLQHYAPKNANDLVNISHNEKGWLDARKGLSDWEKGSNIISNSIIKESFTSKVSLNYNKDTI